MPAVQDVPVQQEPGKKSPACRTRGATGAFRGPQEKLSPLHAVADRKTLLKPVPKPSQITPPKISGRGVEQRGLKE